MSTVTVNVSFPKQLLKAIDTVAKREARSRSELLRTAVRVYVDRQQRWVGLLAFGRQHAKRLRITPRDVERKIAEFRRETARRR